MKRSLTVLLSYLLLTLFANTTLGEDTTKPDISGLKNYNCLLTQAHDKGGILKFEDGRVFCEKIFRKQILFGSDLTHKNFSEKKVTGTMVYPNGDVFVGKFLNGRKWKGYFDRDPYNKRGLKEKTYQSWFAWSDSNRLWYEVDSAVQDYAKCKVVDWHSKTKTKGYIKYSDWEDYKLITDSNEISWCAAQYDSLNIFGFYKIYYKTVYKRPVIILAVILLIIFIIYARKKNYVFNFFEYFLGTKKNKAKLSKAKKRKLESEPRGFGLTNKIARLEKLYRKGALTKTEFEKAKNKLLK